MQLGEEDTWKYVDDTTRESGIQRVVDDLAIQARDDGFQWNEKKCKELRISFARNEPEFDPIWVNRQTL